MQQFAWRKIYLIVLSLFFIGLLSSFSLSSWASAIVQANPANLSTPPLVSQNGVYRVYFQNQAQKTYLMVYAPWQMDENSVLINLSDANKKHLESQAYNLEQIFQNRDDFIQKLGLTKPSIKREAARQYHSYNELIAELERLQSQYPSLVDLVNLGASWETEQGLKEHYIWAIKISALNDSISKPKKVLFLGGHHAREWISIEVPLYIGQYLLENYAQDEKIQHYLSQSEIWIVPLVNPDGYEYSRSSDRWWRKNRRLNHDGSYGVDLNRNYAYKWSFPGSSHSPSQETYHGHEAQSEPEVKSIVKLANEQKFDAMISYHSYGEQIFYPWNYQTLASPQKNLLDAVANKMAAQIVKQGGKSYVVDQAGNDYFASGTTDDWFFAEHQTLSYTIELSPSGAPYFELPESEILPVCKENLSAALSLIEWSLLDSPKLSLLANDKAQQLNIKANQALSLSISLDASNHQGVVADWWLQAQTPNGWFYYDANQVQWLPGKELSYQGQMQDIAPSQLLSLQGLGEGEYLIYYGMDIQANGIAENLDKATFEKQLQIQVSMP